MTSKSVQYVARYLARLTFAEMMEIADDFSAWTSTDPIQGEKPLLSPSEMASLISDWARDSQGEDE